MKKASRTLNCICAIAWTILVIIAICKPAFDCRIMFIIAGAVLAFQHFAEFIIGSE